MERGGCDGSRLTAAKAADSDNSGEADSRSPPAYRRTGKRDRRDRLTETNAACGERSIASVCAGRVNGAAGPAMHQSFHVPSQSSSGYENAQCHAGLPRTSGWWLGWLAVWRLSGWRGLQAGELTYSRRPRPWRPSRVGTPRESPQQSQRPERRGGRPTRSDPTPLAPFVSFRMPYRSCAPSTLYTRPRLASRLASRRYLCVSTSVEMPMMLAAACCCLLPLPLSRLSVVSRTQGQGAMCALGTQPRCPAAPLLSRQSLPPPCPGVSSTGTGTAVDGGVRAADRRSHG